MADIDMSKNFEGVQEKVTETNAAIDNLVTVISSLGNAANVLGELPMTAGFAGKAQPILEKLKAALEQIEEVWAPQRKVFAQQFAVFEELNGANLGDMMD